MKTEREYSEAVAACLAQAIGTNTPFRRVSDYLTCLKEHPNWTDADIIELQTCVIRALLRRTGESEPPNC
jgi:hypothetical protein